MRNGLLGSDDIRMFRARENITQVELAKWFGLSVSSIRALENGFWVPKDLHERIIAALVAYYGLDALTKPPGPSESRKGHARFGRTKRILGEIADRRR